MTSQWHDVVELARTLVRAPSPNPPGDERAVAAAVTNAARSLGLPAPRTVAKDANRPNLLFTIDFGPGGRHLALSGHLDTKPVGDATWQRNPLAAEVDGDRLIGLGSADMKAAIAAMLIAASRLVANPPTRGRLSLLFSADEEDGASFGAHYVASDDVLNGIDGIVIGEPGGIDDDYDRLHLVSRGIARLHVVAEGRQGHSSLSDERGTVDNAGIAAARAVAAIADRFRPEVPDNNHELLGWRATVNTGLAYRGGVGYGVLPGRISVDTEVRLLPGMDRESLLSEARACAEPLAVEFDAPPNDWLVPTMVDPHSALATAARGACTEVLGVTPPDSVFPGTTDAAWFQGLTGIPTLPALGPGLIRRAHGADEWVSIAAALRAVDLYEKLARDFCGGLDASDAPAVPRVEATA